MTLPVISSLVALDPAQIAGLDWSPCQEWQGVEQKLLAREPGLVIGLMRFAPGAGETPHRHDTGDHHVWVLDGRVRTPDGPLGPGSYLHARPGALHQLRDDGPGSTLLFVYHETPHTPPA